MNQHTAVRAASPTLAGWPPPKGRVCHERRAACAALVRDRPQIGGLERLLRPLRQADPRQASV